MFRVQTSAEKHCVHVWLLTKVHTGLMAVLQGVYPAGLEKVKSQELREFITQCIAHDPDSRPGTHQLLKHPFFESIRTGKVQVERCTQLVDRPSEELQVTMQLVAATTPTNTPQQQGCLEHTVESTLQHNKQPLVVNTAVEACHHRCHTEQPALCFLWGFQGQQRQAT